MTILHFTPNQFFDYLKQYGAKHFADYPDDFITVYEKNGLKVPIQIREAYYPCYVIKVCDAFKIKHPIEFDKVAAQIRFAAEMGKNPKK